MAMFFKTIREKAENHMEFIRWLWPAKWASMRFKILNFLSADWLRIRINDVRGGIYRVQMYDNVYRRAAAFKETLSPEEMEKAFQLVCRELDRLEDAADELFKI